MTKYLAAARVKELLSKFGVRRCARGLVVASLITRVEANHTDGHTDHVATVSLAHEVMLLVVGWFWCSHWSFWHLLGHTSVGVRVVVTPPLERGVFTEVRRRQRECHRDRFGVFSQAKVDASNPARRASRCVVATWLANEGG